MTLVDTAATHEAWLKSYYEELPHGSIGNKISIMLPKSGGVTSQPP